MNSQVPANVVQIRWTANTEVNVQAQISIEKKIKCFTSELQQAKSSHEVYDLFSWEYGTCTASQLMSLVDLQISQSLLL